ncbi:MAG TPA: PIG-L family deacetylase [Bryobacteraceae bacterium]|nr:PIG-L family deacetylase [Bryobacteraceae bacterium]
MIVAAHPDDETIGASTLLRAAVSLIHVTDGAPRNMADAQRCGFTCRDEYSRARRGELEEAIAVCGSSPEMTWLDIPDQEASYNIPSIADRLSRAIREVRPAVVLTHPYEGGHPDHDACAAAVRLACGSAVPVWEFACYHNRGGSICTNEFLPGTDQGQTVELKGLEKLQKMRMLECFRTQRETLSSFGTTCERFRPAPDYDFAAPPHPGKLYYEQFDWGMRGERFRSIAAEVLAVC